MNAQETFEKVAKHLLTQNAQAYDAIAEACSYRTSAGLKCAVGCLMSDETLDKLAAEGKLECLVGALPQFAIQELPLEMGLLGCLQDVHDGYAPDRWPEKLRELATARELTIPDWLRDA